MSATQAACTCTGPKVQLPGVEKAATPRSQPVHCIVACGAGETRSGATPDAASVSPSSMQSLSINVNEMKISGADAAIAQGRTKYYELASAAVAAALTRTGYDMLHPVFSTMVDSLAESLQEGTDERVAHLAASALVDEVYTQYRMSLLHGDDYDKGIGMMEETDQPGVVRRQRLGSFSPARGGCTPSSPSTGMVNAASDIPPAVWSKMFRSNEKLACPQAPALASYVNPAALAATGACPSSLHTPTDCLLAYDHMERNGEPSAAEVAQAASKLHAALQDPSFTLDPDMRTKALSVVSRHAPHLLSDAERASLVRAGIITDNGMAVGGLDAPIDLAADMSAICLPFSQFEGTPSRLPFCPSSPGWGMSSKPADQSPNGAALRHNAFLDLHSLNMDLPLDFEPDFQGSGSGAWPQFNMVVPGSEPQPSLKWTSDFEVPHLNTTFDEGMDDIKSSGQQMFEGALTSMLGDIPPSKDVRVEATHFPTDHDWTDGVSEKLPYDCIGSENMRHLILSSSSVTPPCVTSMLGPLPLAQSGHLLSSPSTYLQ
jgi:hypothetical protein